MTDVPGAKRKRSASFVWLDFSCGVFVGKGSGEGVNVGVGIIGSGVGVNEGGVFVGFILLAKTILGLCARIVSKITSHLLKYLLRAKFGIDVISFSQVSA
jgi:hypothetical protein